MPVGELGSSGENPPALKIRIFVKGGLDERMIDKTTVRFKFKLYMCRGRTNLNLRLIGKIRAQLRNLGSAQKYVHFFIFVLS